MPSQYTRCPECGHAMRHIRTAVIDPRLKEIHVLCQNRQCGSLMKMMQQIIGVVLPTALKDEDKVKDKQQLPLL